MPSRARTVAFVESGVRSRRSFCVRAIFFVVLMACAKPSPITRDFHSAEPPPPSHVDPSPVASSSDAGVTPPRGPARLTDDDIAALVLADYDRRTHRVKTLPRASDAGVDDLPSFGVRSSSGRVLQTHAESEKKRGEVRVVTRPGADWAANETLAWVLVGEELGLCANDAGFLALVGSNAVVVAPWSGSCGTEPHEVRFVSSQGRNALLERDGDAGEDSVSERSDRVWLASANAWVLAGNVRTSLEETRNPVVAGMLRTMTANIVATPSAFVSTERWTFTPIDPSHKPIVRTRVRNITLRGDALVQSTQPDPTP
jgi:hypothetical protein